MSLKVKELGDYTLVYDDEESVPEAIAALSFKGDDICGWDDQLNLFMRAHVAIDRELMALLQKCWALIEELRREHGNAPPRTQEEE